MILIIFYLLPPTLQNKNLKKRLLFPVVHETGKQQQKSLHVLYVQLSKADGAARKGLTASLFAAFT